MKRQEETGILSDVVDIPTPLKEVTMSPKNTLESLLVAVGLKKRKQVMLYVRNTNLSTNHQLASISSSLNVVNENYGTVDGIMQAIHDNTYKMAAYVATAIHNQNSEVPQYLIDTIADEFTNAELKIAVEEIYRRIGTQDLYTSLGLVQSLALVNS